MIKLGDEVKDKITGFTGIAVGKAEYLNGCIRIEIQPKITKDGLMIEPHWIDEVQLIDLTAEKKMEEKAVEEEKKVEEEKEMKEERIKMQKERAGRIRRGVFNGPQDKPSINNAPLM